MSRLRPNISIIKLTDLTLQHRNLIWKHESPSLVEILYNVMSDTCHHLLDAAHRLVWSLVQPFSEYIVIFGIEHGLMAL